MKKLRKTLENTKRATTFVDNNEIKRRLEFARVSSKEELFQKFKTSDKGLSEEQVEISREQYGDNSITRGKKASLIKRLYQAFINPFTIILFVLALVSAFTDIILAAPGEKNPQGLIIITTMVLISGILRFVQETRSGNAAENLLKMITTTTNVHRLETGSQEIPIEEVLVGDIIHLSAGDMVPADLRIIQAKDLFISQASLTGESEPVEKLDLATSEAYDSITESSNLAFMGSNIISGSAYGIVIVTGDTTIFGEMARSVTEDSTKTTFEKGVNSVSWVLIRFMLVMVPFVLLINGFTKGDWMEAALFALAVAVGLTPEMLPMIVTTCLAKGAVTMSKEKTIIKNLNSIQNLGSMNILCTDKTGTLTQDKVVLMRHLDIHGQENIRVLRHGFLNSYYQTGLKNLMDLAIIEGAEAKQEKNPELSGLSSKYTKVDEIPFDFERRRMSVVVQSNGNGTNSKTQMITKGAAEEMLDICTLVEDEGKIVPLNSELRQYILKKVDELNELGMRVILVAQKTNPSPIDSFSVQDESKMVLMGYLAFLDPPKESTAKAIKALNKYGVSVKILPGDNDKVTRSVCEQVGLPAD